MSDIIRLASAGPLFRSGGFKLTPRWQSHAVADLTQEQIETLRARVGRWIRVYPDDKATLDELLAKTPPPDPAEITKNTTTKPSKAADTKASKAGKEG